MTIMKRLATALLALLGLALVAAGAALLWVDALLGDAPEQRAEVILAGPRVTDLDLPVEGTDRVRHLQVLTIDGPAAIGSSADVQVIDSPVTLARLAADERWMLGGVGLAASGLLLLVVLTLILVRGRRRRRRAARTADGTTSAPAATATALATLLLISGCSWTGDDVDRAAYRAARAALAAAFPVAPGAATEAPRFGAPESVPVTDPEAAVPVLLDAAGLPSDPSTVTTARLLARQLFDPAMLCSGAPMAPVAELFMDQLADQVAANEKLVVRLPDCGGLVFDGMRIGWANGTETAEFPTGGSGTTVTLTVSAVYSASGAGGAPFTVERTAVAGFLPEQRDRIASVDLSSPAVGGGIGTAVLPEPGAFPAWDEELLDGPSHRDPDSAAEVIRTLAATVAEDAVALRDDTEYLTTGEEPSLFSGNGFMLPARGELQLSFEDDKVRQLRVLGHHREFIERTAAEGGESWHLYSTAQAPALSEVSSTNNPFAAFDWLRHLSAAAPAGCPEGVDATRCHAVEVPTRAALTPGTPGYREALAHAHRGNPTMLLVVGVTDGRLASVTVGREQLVRDGTTTRATTTWSFAPWKDAVPTVDRPPSWTDSGHA